MADQTVSLKLDADASAFKSEIAASAKVMDDLAGAGRDLGSDLDRTFTGMAESTGKAEQGLESLDSRLDTLGSSLDTMFSGFVSSSSKAEDGVRSLDERLETLTGAERDLVIRANVAQAEQGISQIDKMLSDPTLTDTEIRVLMDKRNEATQAIEHLKGEIDELGPAAAEAGDEIERGLDLASLGGAFASAGIADRIDDAQGSARMLRAQLGLTADEAREFDAVAKRVYGNNFGDTMGEASQVTGMVHQSLGLVGDELGDTAESILSISTAFEHVGADAQILTEDIRSMTTNFPGTDEAEALDLIATGFQRGAGNAGDLQDTLNEYPGDFARIGLEADDMVGILISGMEAGARNTDIVADAVRELGIRTVTAGDTGQQALAKMFPHDEAQRLITDMSAGGEAGRAAFYDILEGLAAVQDPQERYNLAVELMGTRGEELANQMPEFVSALGDLRDGTLDAGGAADSTKEQYGGFRDSLEGLMKKIETSALGTLGDVGVGFADVGANVGIAVLGLKGVADMAPGVTSKLGRVAGAAGKIGLAIGGIILLKEAFDALSGSTNDVTVDMEAASRAATEELVAGFEDLADSPLGASAALDAFGQIAEGSIGTAERLRDALVEAGHDAGPLDEIMREAAEGTARMGEDSERAAGAVDELTGSTQENANATDNATDALRDYSAALSATFNPIFAAMDATINLSEAEAELTAVLEDNEATQGEVEAAHRKVAQATIDHRQKVLDLAAAVANGDVDMAGAVETLAEMTAGQEHGKETTELFAAELQNLGIDIANLPDAEFKATTSGVAETDFVLNNLARARTVRLYATLIGGGAVGAQIAALNRHDGGLIPDHLSDGGFPDPFKAVATDTIPAMLTPGEFVVRSEAVEAVGVPFMNALNSGQMGAAEPPVVNVILPNLTGGEIEKAVMTAIAKRTRIVGGGSVQQAFGR